VVGIYVQWLLNHGADMKTVVFGRILQYNECKNRNGLEVNLISKHKVQCLQNNILIR
jgi:hypothetical protein